MGVDSEDSKCRRCLEAGSRSSSFAISSSGSGVGLGAGYDSDGSTVVGCRRPSDASSASASSADTLVEGIEKVCNESDTGSKTSVWLTVPADVAMKRIGSASSFGSTSSTISTTTTAGYARSLMASLPTHITKARRNASGVGLSQLLGEHWEASKKSDARGPAPNMHWRGYDDAVFKATCGA
jgi:hypothetical protein